MEFVKYEQKGFIGVVTIDRPSALNALNTQVLTELEQVMDAVSSNETRCIIITGAGEKSFVAGADIASMKPLTQQESHDWCVFGNRVMRKIETHAVPVIAAVNGFALGGGCELAMSCDIRIASENAIFGQPEVSLGITAGFGGTQRLSRLIGLGRAKELMYTTNKIDANTALAYGLVNAVYPQAELMEQAMKLAEKIARNAPIAVRATKVSINQGIQTDMDSAILIEAKQFGACFETDDQVNAMQAFLEKRKPEAFTNS